MFPVRILISCLDYFRASVNFLSKLTFEELLRNTLGCPPDDAAIEETKCCNILMQEHYRAEE